MFDFLNSENIGKEYNGFLLLSVDDLPDYKAKGVYLRHKRTGLEVYHIVKDDKENLFAFAFRTLEKNSKGTAHIMEHSTLCGSEKFPLKEPFTTLASTSLNTFLNAFTYPDKTVYPGASVVRDDYFTIMDVYADSVFFPKLDYATFLQEGHRLELNKDGKLSVQGIVYNEMKGAYSSFMQVAFGNLIKSMYPDSYPEFESGGDPLEIPNLTYQQFLDFHQRFYNPDNCLLFLYGDIPTGDQLDFINEKYISRLEKKYGVKCDDYNAGSSLPIVKTEISSLQKLNLHQESKEIVSIAPVTGSTGSFVSMNWYSGPWNMEKQYLNEVLFGNDSSPLSYTLKESQLGDDLSCCNYGYYQEEFFTIGLMGVKKDDEQKVYSLIEDSIKKTYEEGIKQEDIDSALMGIDFTLREINRDWGPQGITIMEKVLKSWQNGLPCNSRLSAFRDFDIVKENIKKDKDYTKKLIKKYLIDPKIVIKAVVEPSAEYFKIRKQGEKQLIQKLKENLDEEKLKKDLEEMHRYQDHIETPEETKCIPTTKLSSLDSKLDISKCEIQYINGYQNEKIPLFVSKEETSGIFYLEVLFPFDQIECNKFKYIPFLSNIITNLGWNNKKWDDCITESACVMGDVWGKVCTGEVPDILEVTKSIETYDKSNFTGRYWLGVSCKCLTSKAKESLNLLSEIITTMSFDDKKRFKTLAQENLAEKKSTIVSSGRDYAIKRAKAADSKTNALNEIMWGITQFETVKEYVEKPAKESLENLKNIYQECLKGGGIIHITADEDSLNTIIPMLNEFAEKTKITKLVPKKQFTLSDLIKNISQNELLDGDKTEQIINVESQTGYAVAVSKASPFMSKQAAAESVLTNWLGTHSLWTKIRMSGGAYGASAWCDATNNEIIFTSYRDPTPEKSIDTFAEIIKEVCENPISEEDVEKTIVSCYGDVIVPQAPKDRGSRSFELLLYGSTPEIRQKRIDYIFEVKPDDVDFVAKQINKNIDKTYKKVIFTDKNINSTSKIVKIPL